MSPEIAKNKKYSLVVVGGGGSGLAAAAAAAENGLKNIAVLEKRGATGGSSAMASGIFGAESQVQKRQAIIARKDDLYQRMMDWARQSVNPRLIRAYIEKSADTVRWLEDKGLRFTCVPHSPIDNPLTWHVPRGNGADGSLKKVVTIPVIAVGRLDPVIGEEVLREGKADFIGMTRRLLADPELPNKVAAGKFEEIRPCTACLFCTSRIRTYQPIACQVNAALGNEAEYVIKPAQKKKKVLIIGGGPAGMEAARVSAIRGHKVVLYEKGHKLGGLLPLASMVKGHEGEFLMEFVHYLERQISMLGVDIMIGKEFNPSVLNRVKPDAVIVAAGGIPTIPDIPGINNNNVVSIPKLHGMLKFWLRYFSPMTLGWLTKYWMPVGKNVVIIGGGLQGCELAEFLVKHGRKVTIVESAETLGEGVPERKKHPLFRWLKKKGVVMMAGVKYEEITDKGLIIVTKEGERRTLEADTIVPAVPLTPNNKLYETIKDKVAEAYIIGDCAEPKVIIDAVAAGYRVAITL